MSRAREDLDLKVTDYMLVRVNKALALNQRHTIAIRDRINTPLMGQTLRFSIYCHVKPNIYQQ